jgi:hypothetical protein
VAPSTFYEWQIKHPEFRESILKGKRNADAEVAYGLYKRACGYITADGKEIPPDPTAIQFWLKNRQPKLWRDKQEIEHDVKISGQPLISFGDTSKIEDKEIVTIDMDDSEDE